MWDDKYRRCCVCGGGGGGGGGGGWDYFHLIAKILILPFQHTEYIQKCGMLIIEGGVYMCVCVCGGGGGGVGYAELVTEILSFNSEHFNFSLSTY